MKRLEGKTALITGGASGIGKASAQLFLEEGANVVISDIKQATLDVALQDLGKFGKIVGVHGDVSVMRDAKRMVQTTVESFGRLDILFCNAGITSVSHIEDLTEEEWDRVINTNLKGQFTLVKSALPQMKVQGGGNIITMGSEMGIVAVPESPAYNASKGGIILFTRSIAIDLIKHNIRVNALCPGITRTPLLQQEVDDSADPDATARAQAQWAPILRTADPREIAQGALWLASEDSSFAVGSSLVLDGGFTAQ